MKIVGLLIRCYFANEWSDIALADKGVYRITEYIYDNMDKEDFSIVFVQDRFSQ